MTSYGSPENCGRIDAKAGRPPSPHKWLGGRQSFRLSPQEVTEYMRGYDSAREKE